MSFAPARAILLAAVALTGCGHFVPQKASAPVTVVPVVAPPPPKSCVPRTLGPPPRYPDTDAALRAAAGAADRYQLLAAGRILREQRLDELEKAIAGCR